MRDPFEEERRNDPSFQTPGTSPDKTGGVVPTPADYGQTAVPGLQAPTGGTPVTMPGGDGRQVTSESGTVFDQEIRDAAYGGAQNFMQTGGFSPDDLSNIRARALSPSRAVYANALRNVNRQRAIQGGYSPNYTAALTRMNREQGQVASDSAINAEASIAQLVQSGKLGGLNAMTSMYGNMPTYSRSYGDGGGGGGGAMGEEVVGGEAVAQPKKQGFWGKLGGVLKKIGQVALPIALGTIPGGSIAGKLIGKIGGGASKGALGAIGNTVAGGGLSSTAGAIQQNLAKGIKFG